MPDLPAGRGDHPLQVLGRPQFRGSLEAAGQSQRGEALFSHLSRSVLGEQDPWNLERQHDPTWTAAVFGAHSGSHSEVVHFICQKSSKS